MIFYISAHYRDEWTSDFVLFGDELLCRKDSALPAGVSEELTVFSVRCDGQSVINDDKY